MLIIMRGLERRHLRFPGAGTIVRYASFSFRTSLGCAPGCLGCRKTLQWMHTAHECLSLAMYIRHDSTPFADSMPMQ